MYRKVQGFLRSFLFSFFVCAVLLRVFRQQPKALRGLRKHAVKLSLFPPPASLRGPLPEEAAGAPGGPEAVDVGAVSDPRPVLPAQPRRREGQAWNLNEG